MKRVLIITYYFPPNPSVASNRLGGLAKYLPDYDWEPVVLTTVTPGTSMLNVKIIRTPQSDVLVEWKRKLGFDPEKGFQEQIGIKSNTKPSLKGIIIKRVISPLIRVLIRIFNELIAFPDLEKNWYYFAIQAAEEILKKEKFDVIISSSAPYTAHLIAKQLKLKYNIPWVADFRDLWTQNHYYQFSFLRRKYERWFEINSMLLADAFITVSKPLSQKLGDLHKNRPIFTILNGYDNEGIQKNLSLAKKFTITYTGSIYKGKQNPSLLFKVLNDLITQKEIEIGDLEVRFYGSSDLAECLSDWEVKYKLQNIVHYKGFVSREEAIKRQRESQLLLLLNWTDPHEEGIYTGKVFEYLGAQRPILAIGGPGGVVKGLLEDTNAGIHVNNEEDLHRIILQYYIEYKVNGMVSYHGIQEKVNEYSHQKMAEKFARVLEGITTKI